MRKLGWASIDDSEEKDDLSTHAQRRKILSLLSSMVSNFTFATRMQQVLDSCIFTFRNVCIEHIRMIALKNSQCQPEKKIPANANYS
mmetsp:Transcript_21887/g.33403  ORF Transcript_21887/g.33403 Transcript_21887/m.33403 type:complete len:87 (-) Transcript_21887:82-342(-)